MLQSLELIFLVIYGFSVFVCNNERNFLDIETLKDVKAGDCLVCFSKAMIYKVCIELEKLGHNVAVIYGSLPPGKELVDQGWNGLELFITCLPSLPMDIIHGINFSYTTAMTSQWIITQFWWNDIRNVFAFKRLLKSYEKIQMML